MAKIKGIIFLCLLLSRGISNKKKIDGEHIDELRGRDKKQTLKNTKQGGTFYGIKRRNGKWYARKQTREPVLPFRNRPGKGNLHGVTLEKMKEKFSLKTSLKWLPTTALFI